jgi:hypothetical protein
LKPAKASLKVKALPNDSQSEEEDAADSDIEADFDGKSDAAPTPGARGLGKKMAEVGGQAGKGKSASEMYQKVSLSFGSLEKGCMQQGWADRVTFLCS